MHGEIASKKEFPPAKLEIGELVHVAGWVKGAVFEIVSFTGGVAVLRTLKTKRETHVHKSRLLGLK